MSAFIESERMKSAVSWTQEQLLRLIGITPPDGSRPITDEDYARIYRDKPSFAQFLPFKDFDKEDCLFQFEDGCSVGAVFELQALDVEGRSAQVLQKIESGIQKALQSIPGHHDSPWILQCYLQDDPLQGLIEKIREYATPEARESKHHEIWLWEFAEHIVHMGKPGGLFYDACSQFDWNGQYRKIRLVLYRRSQPSEWLTKAGKPIPGKGRPAEEIHDVINGLLGQLEQIGVQAKRYTGRELYQWLLPWFSPRPDGFKDAWDYLETRHYPDDESSIGVSSDLAEMVSLGYPESRQDGAWLFTGVPHRLIPLQAIDTPPVTGVLTAEQETAQGKTASLWDRLPKGSIFVNTIVIQPQSQVKKHCDNIIKSAGQGSSEAIQAASQAHAAKDSIATGRYLYPAFAGLYVRGEDDEALAKNTQRALNVLIGFQFNPVLPRYDPTAMDNYLRFLPMAYSFEHDQRSGNTSLTRLTFIDHLARMLPFYGRGSGTGNPGKLFFNRIGGPLMFDPVKDRSRVAHSLIFGPTGSGKSASINYMVMHDMAMCLPRTIIIEKGDSFGLLGRYFKSTGLSVNQIKFTPASDISLPPYSKAFEALKQAEANEKAMELALMSSADDQFDEQGDLVEAEDEMRDYLGEMELITRMMITGADIRKEEKIDLPEKLLVRRSILEATRKQRDSGLDYVIPSNVVAAMRDLCSDQVSEKRRELGLEMADALEYWTDGLHGKFFNRPGKSWPECDVTILDMGILTSDQYQDMLAVTMVSLINTITGIGEKYQYEGRQTQVWTDEGHAITTNPTLVKPLVFGAKTWRKLSIWLNQATQNLEDYPDEASKMLSLAEWWYCLVMDHKEVEELSRFKRLSEEEKTLLTSARKEKGKYTEGVVLSDNVNSLFRIVMPALPLALAGTDDDEKAERRRIMQERNCSEIDAVHVVAGRIKERRMAT